MSETRQTTIRDYVRVLGYSRWLIVAVTLLCAGLAAGLSLSQTTKYNATAQVSFQEESISNAAAGLNSLQTLTPAQLAAVGATTMLSSAVLEQVRRGLKTPLTVAQLRSLLTVTVDPSSALVLVQATVHDPRFAAALANEVANDVVAIKTSAERQQFASTARSIKSQYQRLRNSGSRTELALASLLDRFTTLRTLSLNATPARVADVATVPSSPASPRPLRSIVFAGLIGLVLGVGLAFARNSLDRRLRNLSEIQEALEMPVLGTVRAEALGNAAYMSNGRGPMTEQDIESFRVLRTNIAFLDIDRPLKSILVTSPLPGEGKSTVAASLAAASVAAGKRTLLLECDLRRPCFPDRMAVKRGPGLSDYLAGDAQRAQVVQYVDLAQDGTPGKAPPSAPAVASPEAGRFLRRASALSFDTGGKLAVVTSGSHSIRPAELLGSVQFRKFVEEVVATYDTVIIDTPPLLSVSDTLEVIPLVDSVLLCIRVDQTTRDQARAVREALSHLPDRVTGVVVTGLKRGRESDYGYYSYAYEER